MNLLIRADASVGMGTGHVMRCLALAQAWQDAGGRAFFAMAESTPAIDARLAAEQFEAISISEKPENMGVTIDLAGQRKAEWVVLDGYQFSSDSQRALKSQGLKVLAVDDCGQAGRCVADAVLDQNVSAAEARYGDREPYTRLLLGPRYALLRREFVAWRHWAREVPLHPRRILVVMGGSDPQNVTSRVIQALEFADGNQVGTTIVVGSSNPHFTELQQAAARSKAKLQLVRDPQSLPDLMADADVAISAAGSTCWELCLLGLPALLIDIAPNQTALARELHQRRCAIYLGDPSVAPQTIAQQLHSLIASQQCRKTLSQNCRELVDGNGARRVVSALREGKCMWLRPLTGQDSSLLFEWVNDPEVRAVSFSSEDVTWQAHSQWFEKKLASIATGESAIFVAEDEDGTPIGQIRFDSRTDGEWEVDVSLSAAVRGRGFGGELIRRGVRIMREKGNAGRVHAFVKPSNAASVKAFERSAFRRQGAESVAGHDTVHLINAASENDVVASPNRGRN